MRCKFIDVSFVVGIFSIEMVKNIFGRIVVKNCNDIVKSEFISVFGVFIYVLQAHLEYGIGAQGRYGLDLL